MQIIFSLKGFFSSGTDPEDTIVQAFKLLDPDNKGVLHKDL